MILNNLQFPGLMSLINDTLGWSRAAYVELVRRADTAAFIQCHVNAFEYLGGVPRRCLYDNAKVITLGRDEEKRPVWNERLLDFSLRVGFELRLCRPYRAQTKGSRFILPGQWAVLPRGMAGHAGKRWRCRSQWARWSSAPWTCTSWPLWEAPGNRPGTGPPAPGESRAQAGRGDPGQHPGRCRQQAADLPGDAGTAAGRRGGGP